jgi:hypothetical protein
LFLSQKYFCKGCGGARKEGGSAAMSIRAESCQQLGSCRQDHARAVNRRFAPFVFFKMSMSSPTAINAGTIYDAGIAFQNLCLKRNSDFIKSAAA